MQNSHIDRENVKKENGKLIKMKRQADVILRWCRIYHCMYILRPYDMEGAWDFYLKNFLVKTFYKEIFACANVFIFSIATYINCHVAVFHG